MRGLIYKKERKKKMKKIFLLVISTIAIFMFSLNNSFAACFSPYGLNENGVCIDCRSINQRLKNGICYTCSTPTLNHVAGCNVDDEGHTTLVCAGYAGWNADKSKCIDCRGINQKIKNGTCYTCPSSQHTAGCNVDDEGRTTLVCADYAGWNADKSQCIDCRGQNQIKKDGTCYTCSNLIAGCNRCSISGEGFACNNCTAGSLTNGLCIGNQDQTCEKGKYLTLAGTCAETCPIGQYGDKKSGKCRTVTANCEEMRDDIHCQTCKSGYLEKDGECIAAATGCGDNYKRIENWCNRIRWTPAEAAEVLFDDNSNEVTITFRK